MNANIIAARLLGLLLLPCALEAAPASSLNYSISAHTLDSGGGRSASASYSNDGSIGGFGGISTTPAAQTARHGYVGQLYEVTSLALSALPATVNEGGTRQLTASALLDDGTTLAASGTTVAWTVVNGPVASVNASGLATAGFVYQDTPAIVRGSLQGQTNTVGLTVLNAGNDDFGTYANDGVDDAWQVDFFGENNLSASPANDPDGDGQNNLFEYTAGTAPTNALSKFNFTIAPVAGQPSRKDIVFSPRFPSRTYAVQFRNALDGAGFSPLTGSALSDNGTERTVTDLNATEATRFYRVQISLP